MTKMNLQRLLVLISAALTLGNATSRGVSISGPTSYLAYNITLTDPAAVLPELYLFDGSATYGFQGYYKFDNVNYDGGVSHPFLVPAPYGSSSSFGALGVYGASSGGTVTGESVFVAFNSLTPVPAGTSFDTFFAPFLQADGPALTASGLSPDESGLVAVLNNPAVYSDGDGILNDFTSYLERLAFSNPATTAPIGTGSLTLYHFSGATAFGDSTAMYVVPEPSTWTAVLAGTGLLGLVLRRRVPTRRD